MVCEVKHQSEGDRMASLNLLENCAIDHGEVICRKVVIDRKKVVCEIQTTLTSLELGCCDY